MDSIIIHIPPVTVAKSPSGPNRAHQDETARALLEHDVVINDSMTGSGKTRAALLHLKHLDRTWQKGYHTILYIAPVNSLALQTFSRIRKFLKDEKMDDRFAVFPVMASTLNELRKKLKSGRRHEEYSNADLLSMLFADPVSMATEVTAVIATQPGVEGQSIIDHRVNYILVINPDIFYYALFTKRYEIRLQDIHVNMLENIKYVIFDEFHYYTMFQLNAFIAVTSFWKANGKFASGDGKMCLLSATPNAWLLGMMERMGLSVAVVNDTAIRNADRGSPEPFLAPVRLHVHEKTGGTAAFDHEMVSREDVNAVMEQYIHEGRFGAVICNSIRHANDILFHYKGKIGDEYFSRITGPVDKTERARAVNAQCVCCTSTVDIGFEFERKSQNGRQFIDFLFIDFATRDEFTQRLGRAARVSGEKEHADIPSDVHAFFSPATFAAIKERFSTMDIKSMTRQSIVSTIEQFIPEKQYGDRFFKEFGYFTCRLFVDAIRDYAISKRTYTVDPGKDDFFSAWEDTLVGIYGASKVASNRYDMLHCHSRDKDQLWKIPAKNQINFLYHYFTDNLFCPVNAESGMATLWRRVNGNPGRRVNREEMTEVARRTFIENKDDPKTVEMLRKYKKEVSDYYQYNKRFFSAIIDNFRDGDDINIDVSIKDPLHLLTDSDDDGHYDMIRVMNSYYYNILDQGTDDRGEKMHDPVVSITGHIPYRPVTLALDLTGDASITVDTFEGNNDDVGDAFDAESRAVRRFLWKFGWFPKGTLQLACQDAKEPVLMEKKRDRGVIGYIVPEHYLYSSRGRGFQLVVSFRDGTKCKYALFTGKNALEMRCSIVGKELHCDGQKGNERG